MQRTYVKGIGNAGMTLVELMVAIGITTIIMALSTLIFVAQYKSYRTGQAVKTAEVDVQKAMELVRDDLTLAGWAVKPQMAFYLVDGGNAAPDEVYVNDISIIDPRSTTQMLKLVDSGPTHCGGCRRYQSGAIDTSDGGLDINGDAKDDLKNTPVLIWASDSNVTRVRITGSGGGFSTTPSMSYETYATPAIYYSVTDNATTHTLKRRDRDSSGSQPLAGDVVDLQVVYGNSSDAGCTATTCPPPSYNLTPNVGYGSTAYGQMNPFDASKVSWINLYMVTRSAEQDRSRINDHRSCRPAVANHAGDNSTAACGYEYRVSTTRITPMANQH